MAASSTMAMRRMSSPIIPTTLKFSTPACCSRFTFFSRDDLRIHERLERIGFALRPVAVNVRRHLDGRDCGGCGGGLNGFRLNGGRRLNRLRLRGRPGRGRRLFLIPASAQHRRQEEPYTEPNDRLFLIFSFHWPALFYPQTYRFSRCRMRLSNIFFPCPLFGLPWKHRKY